MIGNHVDMSDMFCKLHGAEIALICKNRLSGIFPIALYPLLRLTSILRFLKFPRDSMHCSTESHRGDRLTCLYKRIPAWY
jgi:hypothetical protein